MISKLIYIGLLNFFAVMSPGPDFAVVSKNTMMYSRRIGFYTSFGIGLAIFLHITYCALGLAVVITNSTTLFAVIALSGGSYLIYSGIDAFKASNRILNKPKQLLKKEKQITNLQAIKNGFFTNILNPKAILFFLAIFSFFIEGQINFFFTIVLALELFLIVVGWFCFLTYMLSHKKIEKKFQSLKPIIIKLTGCGLIILGILLISEELMQFIT